MQVILDHEITPREMHALCYGGREHQDLDEWFTSVVEHEEPSYFGSPTLEVEDDSYGSKFLVYVEGYDIMDYFVILHESSFPETGVRHEGNARIHFAVGQLHGYRVVFDSSSEVGNMSDVMHFLSRRMSSLAEILLYDHEYLPIDEAHALWLHKWESAGKYGLDPRILS